LGWQPFGSIIAAPLSSTVGPFSLHVRGVIMSGGRLLMSRALTVQGTAGSSTAACHASATWSRHSAHPALVLRQSDFTFHQRGVCFALAQPFLRPLPALLARHCRCAVVRRARKAAAFSVKPFRPPQRVTHANESVIIVFSITRGYNSGWSCNPSTAQQLAAADAANAAINWPVSIAGVWVSNRSGLSSPRR